MAEGLGEPNSAGGQNDLQYAYFAEKHRLAVSRGGKVEVYDTGDHDITGVSQQQPGGAGGRLGPTPSSTVKTGTWNWGDFAGWRVKAEG